MAFSKPLSLNSLDSDPTSRPAGKAALRPTTAFRGFPRLSFRGAAALGFTLYLFLLPVAQSQDILAAIIAFSLTGLLLMLLISAGIIQRILRKRLDLSGHSHHHGSLDDVNETGAVAARWIEKNLSMRGLFLPALFRIEVSPFFEQPGVEYTELHLSGMLDYRDPTGAVKNFRSALRFPHRGTWKDLGFRIRLSDHFDLCQAIWTISPESPISLPISPARYAIPNLPFLASFENPGDLQIAQSEPLGDPFDLKAYHPSDGAKKIHWKIFARRRELVSRHPERTMTPEGLALLFCFTDRQDDAVCRVAEQFAQQLRSEDIHYLFGCEGMSGQALAANAESMNDLFLGAVWNCPMPDEGMADIQDTLEQASRALGKPANSICIFVSEERLCHSSTFGERMTRLFEHLQHSGCRPQIFLVRSNTLFSSRTRPRQGLYRLFIEEEAAFASTKTFDFKRSTAFTQALARLGMSWELVEVLAQGEST
jgi:hypothetical protein